MASNRPLKVEVSDVPIPTTRRPTQLASQATVRRAKTLTRPERSVAPVPLITPQPIGVGAAEPVTSGGFDPWKIFSRIVTFWAPGVLLSSLGGLNDKQKQQAWREKIALCLIIICLCGTVGFITVGLQNVFCPQNSQGSAARFISVGSTPGFVAVGGFIFNSTQSNNADIQALATKFSGQDISNNFQRPASFYTACAGGTFHAATDDPCANTTNCQLGALNVQTITSLGLRNTSLRAGYDWDQVAKLTNYLVIDGTVLNMTPYVTAHKTTLPGDNIDTALRAILSSSPENGKDGTLIFYSRNDLKAAVPCLTQRYHAGNIDKITPGCFISQLVLYAGLIVILGLIMIRFVMACIFNWFLSTRLAGNVSSSLLNKSAISPNVMPEGANISIDNVNGQAPWAGGGQKKLQKAASKSARSTGSGSTLVHSDPPAPVMSLTQIGAELFAVCLVTCYSEGEDSLRTTLDSISTTHYSDSRKLLFIVADGMITGAGEKRSTPDICVSLLEPDPRFGNPMPMVYEAVGSGAKAENRAMVYAGHYTVAGRKTPAVIVVKCGTEKEAATDKKPGNRGKRDSQLILMNFFSRVTYNDRMTPLDFDLFRKIHILMGVTPDFFEVCLMVDADTKVYPESLKHLVNCMHNDQMIMGVCGETRIANKRQSWVTAIQVFEYFISHHMAKAFESVFGGVSCLPGCFSMFRLKARKFTGDDWIPLIIKPEIVKEYSQSDVVTLHQKNLLLLGEDRFLTTILIRTFPNRKMMFLPQAKCRTVVPDTFSVLLSQRRRWINSTIHNLMELVLVRNLCGTFCFSMQFVVFMDLLGTVVLPIAIVLTYVLIVGVVLAPPKSFEEAIPVLLLGAVLGLPAVLILITTMKVVYVFWMLIYLLALPVWNLILPVYAFWHFDDFSWGETRKVEGEAKGEAHGDGPAIVQPINVPLRRWEDWERSRLRKLRREEKRRREFERTHPVGYQPGEGYLGTRHEVKSYDGSDSISVSSSDDDHWGLQIGGYNEHNPSYPPPPMALHMKHANASGETLAGDQLEAMLEVGFEEGLSPNSSTTRLTPRHHDRHQLHDTPVTHSNGYTALSRTQSPTTPNMPRTGDAISSGIAEWKGHVKKRSGGRGDMREYGPLGPLDPDSRI